MSMIDFDAKAATWDADPQKVDRARRVASAIATRVPDLAGRRVLEYGCGTGLLGFALRPLVASVTMADSSPGMLEELRRKIAASGLDGLMPLRLDLATDPPPAERFDLICSLMALHHVPDTAGLLRAFRGLLEPGGMVCLSDLDAEDGSFHGAGVHVHHGFDRGVLQAQLEACGFQEVRVETVLEIQRAATGAERRYPIFLATARVGPGRT
jgi:2-polyprenyl-3-methyl-5-hydroxy-6-metoxy-1,4-benzoquinol methylase